MCDLDELRCTNNVLRVVPCPWPPDMDAVRLEPILAAMRTEAVAALRRDRQRQGLDVVEDVGP